MNCSLQRARSALIFFSVLIIAGCAATNQPINQPKLDGSNAPIVEVDSDALADDSLFIGLAFSGGGMRASAFSYGMLETLQAAGRDSDNPDGLLPHVRLVTGVSGGSVTAAYFGLNGAEIMDGYRDDYLIRDAEKYMANSGFNPVTIARGLSGGANGRRTFGRFLNEALFHGATFGDLARRSDILTWINATDMANKSTFLFSPETFDALCSDLSRLPLSEAVSASAAFPIVFSPVVLESHGENCDYSEPDWLTSARFNPEATSVLRLHGKTLESYASAETPFVKLLDGGITDNFGTTALSIARAKSQNLHGPLTAQQAVRVNRLMFLVANAGVESNTDWTQQVGGPGGVALAMSIVGTSMGSATRTAYDTMRLTLDDWHKDVVEFRCSLSTAQVRRLRGTTSGWDCRDVKLFVGEVSFDGLGSDMRAQLNDIPTRLKLPVEQVDLAIQAGRLATRQNAEFNGFLRSVGITRPSAPAAGATQIAPTRITPDG
ncbi:MAG: patatin-like phospholipase family protein [Rhodobacteraceae bacterium]|nr:patatin-like phospholipase family protein [Paracoccaceae bacterium]